MSRSLERDIPAWAAKQIRSGLKLDKNTDIRTALDTLNLEYVTEFFRGEKDTPKNREKDAYMIAMYQKALSLIEKHALTIDGLYRMKNRNKESETKQALRKFQASHQIDADGIPGPVTATKIYEELLSIRKSDKKIILNAVTQVEKQSPSLTPAHVLERGHFGFTHSTPIQTNPVVIETPIPVPTLPKETSALDDLIAGFKSRFVWK